VRYVKVKELMHTEPATVLVTASIYDAALLMKERDVGTVIVIDDGNHIKGMVTDRNVALSVTEFKNLRKAPVSDIMSRKVITIKSSDDIADALKVMKEHNVRRLPVKANGKLAGILSSADVAIELKEELDEFMDVEDSYAESHKFRYYGDL